MHFSEDKLSCTVRKGADYNALVATAVGFSVSRKRGKEEYQGFSG